MKILEVKNLRVSFGKFKAVKGINFYVRKGKVSAIVGESGSGKSVSCLSLLSLLHGANVTGKAIYDEIDILKLNEELLEDIRGKKISFIFQEPMTSLNPLHKIGKQISEVLTLHNIVKNKKEALAETERLLNLVNIDKSRYDSYPHELSGGQRQRVMIAMAIACSPDLLIADEPTTALDVSIQKEIMDLLKDLQRRIGLSILIVTHDLNLVEKFADDIFVMNNGRIVEFGSSKQIFNKPEHKYTKKLIKASKGTPLDKDEIASDIILKVDNLSVEYKNGVKAVKNVSFKVRRGATLAIIGESGSGKTSILNAILRLISVRSGEAYFNKNNIFSLKSKDLRQLRRKMQIVFQDPFSSLSPRMSISQIIEEPLKIHKIGNKITRKKTVDKVLKEVGLPLSMKDKYPHEFSGGQRQRVAIARALILNPELLILDEPTSALDVCVQEEIINLLNDIQKDRGLSYVFVSHDLKLIKNIADYAIVLKNGAIIEQNTAKKLFFQPIEKYTKKLLDACFAQ